MHKNLLTVVGKLGTLPQLRPFPSEDGRALDKDAGVPQLGKNERLGRYS